MADERRVLAGSRRSNTSDSFGGIRWLATTPLCGNFAMQLAGSFDEDTHQFLK